MDDWEAVTKNNQVSFIRGIDLYPFQLTFRDVSGQSWYLCRGVRQSSNFWTNSRRTSSKISRPGLHIVSGPLTPLTRHSLREPELLISHIVSGLIVYFDRSLGANLLYRFERPQYADVRERYKTGQQVIIGQEKEVSAVYGAEHLLRMIGELFLLASLRY